MPALQDGVIHTHRPVLPTLGVQHRILHTLPLLLPRPLAAQDGVLHKSGLLPLLLPHPFPQGPLQLMALVVQTGAIKTTTIVSNVCCKLLDRALNIHIFLTECVASFGGPSASYTPPTATSVSSSGSGATHTVIVAPTQGVLRFVPFAVNASVGDTIQFMWGANNHTVTKSSALTPCNKTAAQPFSSGEQNKGFVCKAYSL